MMQDVSVENLKITSEVRTIQINEDSQSPLALLAVQKSQVISSPSNFGPDMSGSDEDEASEVDSFILDENDMEGGEEVLEPNNYNPKFLLTSETEGQLTQQQLQTVDPETHARLEALLEAAGISKLSSKDGKALTDPEVLRTLTSSVSSALDEATQAINCMRSEQNHLQGAEGVQGLTDRDPHRKRSGTFVYESGTVPDTTEEGESLLSLACSAGYYELAQVLLAMNANVEDRGIKGDCTPLMEAAAGGYVDIVRLLILHGADVNAQSSAGNTPLHSAACAGHTNVVKELISHGASVEVHNENGHTPLMEAASAGHVEIAQLLLEAGAGINTHSNEFKESALTLACYKGHLQMVKYLLDAGADQEHKTDEMHTALMEASMDGHVEVARLLLDSGAQVNMPADSFESPLTLAACGGHVELANLLIERGANIEEVNDEGYTPLMEAAREGHDEMVALLLSHGADINAQTEETQETALTLACCGGFQDVVKLLIKAGADIELGCSTPLMEAAQEGHKDLVKFLLENAANVHAQTGTNDTALTYACENGHTDVASLLLKHGAFLEHESEGGRTPLMKAARAGHLCTVKFLVSKGADVNRSTSTNDHTVLSLACAGGHQQVVEYLLANGADANHKLKDGSTMIIEAAKGGHTNVVKLLLEWPSRLMLNSIDLAHPDSPHMSMAQAAVEEPRVPVQGLAHIVPPNDPNSELHAGITVSAATSQGKVGERLNGGKVLGKRALSMMSGNGDTKAGGKAGSSMIADSSQQIPPELAPQLDLTDDKATEKVEALISNIMAKELLGPSVGSKEEQLQRKQQILEELQKVERELKEKAQVQQQLEQQQLKSRLGSGPAAMRQVEETAKKMMELSATAGPTGLQRGLAESLCLTGTPVMESLPLKDLVVQLPKLLSSPDLAAQSFMPNPAFAASEPFLQNPASCVSSAAQSSVVVGPGVCANHQSHPPSTPFLQQPLPTSVNGGKASKGRGNAGKVTRTTKSPLQQPPLAPPLQQQQAVQLPVTAAQHLQVLAQHAEQYQGVPAPQADLSLQPPMALCTDSLQHQQHLQQLTFPQLTSQQQEQLLQHMLSQQVLQPSAGQPTFQAPIHQFVSQPQTQAGQQLLTQQERVQLLHQTQQAQLLQQQLLKQTANSTTPAIPPATIGSPSAVPLPPLPADKSQQGAMFPSSLDVDSQTESNHDTALTLACAGGHSELVSLLLAKGADIEHRDKKGFTPLILAATAGHQEVVEILLDHGADIEAQSERTKDTPLSLACSGGRFEVVELLLSRGANKEHRNVSDYTPLSLAASGGYVNIIKLLLSHGAEINSRTGSKLGISPLMLAAMNGHTQAVKLLLDMGSDINAQIETNRNTALTLACFQGRHEVVSLLVDRKANIEHRAKTGLTPLMEAASGGYVEVGRVLLDKGADVNAPPVPSSRDTALTIAADKGHYRFVELLLHRGASVDVKNKKGNSPLWLACNGGHLDVVQLLVTAGADIDSQDNRKVSCLMAAFRKGHIKVVKWMVKHVTQFPSDSELQRFVSAATDKELQKKCQQCMDIIVSAKDRQAAEANKNANILLQEIDRERELDEQKKQIAAKRRERRKERKKKGKQEKKDGKEKNSSPEPDSENGLEKDQGEEEFEEEKIATEPPTATVTSTLGTSLVTASEVNVSKSNIFNSTSSMISSPSPSTSSRSQMRSIERRINTEMRKNQRNRKEKLLEAQGQAKEISEGYNKPTSSAILNTFTVTNAAVRISLQSNVSSDCLHSSSNLVNNAKRRRNDIKAKARGVAELDDFGFLSGKSSLSKDIDRLGKSLEKAKINTSDLIVNERDNGLASKVSSLGTSPRKGQRKDDGWKEVTRKTPKRLGSNDRVQPSQDECRYCGAEMNPDPLCYAPGTTSYECSNCRSKRVTVPANVISRVIGRGGSNINSIRDASGAHVDIEKSQKGAVDRVITIKGSGESTKLAHTLITTLVHEPEKDLSEFIFKLKGRQIGDKSQQVPATIGDFAIGMFSVPTTSSQSGSTPSSKSSSSKSGTGRQSANSGSVVNGRSNACSVATPVNVWQNSAPLPGAPSSPRRSPQKQIPPSLLQSAGTSGMTNQEKSANRQLHSDRHSSPVTAATSNISVSGDTATSSSKSSQSSSAGIRSMTESRQSTPTPSTAGVSPGGKAPNRQPSISVRVLQRQTQQNARPEPQPLPIVSSHMPNHPPANSTTLAATPTTSSTNFSTFHLWNPSPTPTLSKKEDFASVAAAGVVINQSIQLTDKSACSEPDRIKNDPSKAPGYKAGIRTASPQLRQDQVSISSPMVYHATEPLDLPHLHPSLSSMPVMPSHYGIPMPNPAGDGTQIPHNMHFLGHPEHPMSNPFAHLHQPMVQNLGPTSDQVLEYCSPTVPMTLPEIKSQLNPHAPDFSMSRMCNMTSILPTGFVNGYPHEEVNNGVDMIHGGRGDGSISTGMTSGSNMEALLLYTTMLQNLSDPEQFNQLMMQLRQQPMIHGPSVSSGGSGPGAPPLIGRIHEGPAGPNPLSQPVYMGPQATVTPMPPIMRPSSAPSMSLPDSAPSTPIRPSNLGSPMSPRTPPSSDGKQTPENRVPRPIGGERAARKLPVNVATPDTVDYNMIAWGTTEPGRKDWNPAVSPHMAIASLSTSVNTSSVVMGSNMATGSNMSYGPTNARDSQAHLHPPETLPFPDSFPHSFSETAVQNTLLMQQQQMFGNANGLNFNQPGTPGGFGFRGGGMGGDTVMWHHPVKNGPNDAGDSEGPSWRSWSSTD